MDITRAATRLDALANLSSALISGVSPRLWRALGLPEGARLPSAGALAASGAWHTLGVDGPSRRHLQVGAGINAAWVVAGLAAQRLPLRPWQRALVGAVIGYDVAMTTVKASGTPRAGSRLGRS